MGDKSHRDTPLVIYEPCHGNRRCNQQLSIPRTVHRLTRLQVGQHPHFRMTNRFWKIENAVSFTQQNVASHRPKTAVLDSSARPQCANSKTKLKALPGVDFSGLARQSSRCFYFTTALWANEFIPMGHYYINDAWSDNDESPECSSSN